MAAKAAGHHADRVEAAIASNAPAQSALVASWRRSASLHRLDPADHKPPRRLELSQMTGTRMEVISSKTEEGIQLASLGGVGGILRFMPR